MPVKKQYDNQLTTPISTGLKMELVQIKEELGLTDLTDLVRRVLRDFVDAYYKRQTTRQGVPAVAKAASLGGGAQTVASIRNIDNILNRLSGKINIPDESTEMLPDEPETETPQS